MTKQDKVDDRQTQIFYKMYLLHILYNQLNLISHEKKKKKEFIQSVDALSLSVECFQVSKNKNSTLIKSAEWSLPLLDHIDLL